MEAKGTVPKTIEYQQQRQEGLKPPEPIEQEPIPVRGGSDFCSKKKNSANAANAADTATTEIIFSNSTHGDDEVWRATVSASRIASIATTAIGRPISDDKILRLCLVSHIEPFPAHRPADSPAMQAIKTERAEQLISNPTAVIECFYINHQSLAEISKQTSCPVAKVKEYVKRWDPESYKNECMMRSREKKLHAAEKKLQEPKTKPKRVIEATPGLSKRLD
jgi:hypothetical protein